ncbi:MAG: hypothetical protein ACK5JT_00760, partial [Hyphomicrobiaceae bacterium]
MRLNFPDTTRSAGASASRAGGDWQARVSAIAAVLMLAATLVPAWMMHAGDGRTDADGAPQSSEPGLARQASSAGNEVVASIYAGVPFYRPNDVHLQRPDGTDMTFKKLRWDSDAFYFPIDGGARAIHWLGSVGYMVDFLHGKAIAELGKGTHGRKIKNGVIQDAETTGTLKGKPAPSPFHLT